jgi:hypothetical protein
MSLDTCSYFVESLVLLCIIEKRCFSYPISEAWILDKQFAQGEEEQETPVGVEKCPWQAGLERHHFAGYNIKLIFHGYNQNHLLNGPQDKIICSKFLTQYPFHHNHRL